MLEDHKRAAMMPNEADVTWVRFVRSRFVGGQGRGAASLTVDILAATQQSGSHAALAGLLEYATDASLPVVFEFVGTLDLETREVLLDDPCGDLSERSYSGRLSENGRVLTLRSRYPGKAHGKPLHLIHEDTRRDLLGE